MGNGDHRVPEVDVLSNLGKRKSEQDRIRIRDCGSPDGNEKSVRSLVALVLSA